MSSADNLCKQFGPRSGPTKRCLVPSGISERFLSMILKAGACLRAKSKYAGGGYGRGTPPPIR